MARAEPLLSFTGHGASIQTVLLRTGEDCRQSTYFAAYLWGGLVRIELVSSSETSRLVFLGTPKLLVTSLFLSNQAAAPSLDSSASFGADSVAAQGGLRLVRQVTSLLPRTQSIQAQTMNLLKE